LGQPSWCGIYSDADPYSYDHSDAYDHGDPDHDPDHHRDAHSNTDVDPGPDLYEPAM
jgi:hypothetical protein